MSASANSLSRLSNRFRKPGPARLKGNQGNTNEPRTERRGPHGQLFSPGDTVRESGIYEVAHHAHHRESHEVVMIAKDLFPTCDTCVDRVRFRLVRTAPYIFSDEDFEEEQ